MPHPRPRAVRPVGAAVVLCGFLLVAGFYFITEHTAHVFGALPYLLILVCPLMHMFQLPLYTIWRSGTAGEIVQAILHCTAGDALITAVTLLAALTFVGLAAWPEQRFRQVMGTTVIFAAGYAVYSEYLNTVVHQSWSYTAWMPTLPYLGTGLAPFAQWLVVPTLAMTIAHRASRG